MAARVVTWHASTGWEQHDRSDVAAQLADSLGGSVAAVLRHGDRVRLLLHPPPEDDESACTLMLVDLAPAIGPDRR